MSFLLRFGAVSGVVCGLLIAVPGAIEAVTGETAPTSFALGLAPAFGLPLLTALHVNQSRSAGRLGAIGYAVNTVGLGLFGGAAFTLNMALFYLDDAVVKDLVAGPTRFALLGSAVVFVVGVVLFAASMIRARVYPRVPAWLYGLSFPPFAVAARLPDSVLTSALHVLVGAALVWLATAIPRVASAA